MLLTGGPIFEGKKKVNIRTIRNEGGRFLIDFIFGEELEMSALYIYIYIYMCVLQESRTAQNFALAAKT